MGLREQYLGLQKKANREETYLIKSFLIETEKTDNAQAFQKLGLKPLLTQLKTVNEQYEQKTASRAEAQAMNALPPTKELRKQLDGYYHAFTTKIGALAIVNPNPELEAFVKSFNKLVKDTRELWKLHIVQLGLWTEEGGREDDEAPSANGETESGE